MPSIEQAQKIIFDILKEFESDILAILKHSPVALRIMRVSDRHITFANPRYMDMFEVKEKDLQTLTPLKVYQKKEDFEALSLRIEKQENIVDEEVVVEEKTPEKSREDKSFVVAPADEEIQHEKTPEKQNE